MSLYYQDDFVELYHGDSLEILPTLDIKADVLLTDPPYFKVKQEEWDNQWDKASEFLGWMGDFLDRAKPLLTPQASVWVFASPAMTSSVERLVADRFRVLNSIRWAKSGGDNLRRVSMPAMRSFVSIWEGILFAEQFAQADFEKAAGRLYNEIHRPVGQYIEALRKRTGMTRSEVEVALGYASKSDPTRGTGLMYRWEEGDCLPPRSTYEALVHLVQTFDPAIEVRTHAALKAEWDALTTEYDTARMILEESERRPFTVSNRKLTEDIWTFPSVAGYPGKHPCEKPESLMRHMIDCSSSIGDLILDPFAGSGATLIAASKAGRRAVGIEKDERWCEHAASRLSQGTFDLGLSA